MPREVPKPADGDDFEAQKAKSDPESNREALIQERAEQVPESARLNYLRAAHGELSPRGAIKSFCLECVGYDRESVRYCTGYACPLYLYRPFQRSAAQPQSVDVSVDVA